MIIQIHRVDTHNDEKLELVLETDDYAQAAKFQAEANLKLLEEEGDDPEEWYEMTIKKSDEK